MTTVTPTETVTPPVTTETQIPPHVIPYERLPEKLKALQIQAVIRTDRGCFGMKTSPTWGSRLVSVEDPEPLPSVTITADQIDTIQLPQNFAKIPQKLWQRVVQLFLYFCDPDNKTVDEKTEVSVRFTKKRNDLSSWRCWVPRQEVGGATVRARFDQGMVDIETGEILEGNAWPLEDEYDAGSSHSHNTMSTFFSGVDDENEKPCPGLHIVVGNISITTKQYVALASIVLDRKRFYVSVDDTIETDAVDGVSFHPNVLQLVRRVGHGNSSSSVIPIGDIKFERVTYRKDGTRVVHPSRVIAQSSNLSENVKQLFKKTEDGASRKGEVEKREDGQKPSSGTGLVISDRAKAVDARVEPDASQIRGFGNRLKALLEAMAKSPSGLAEINRVYGDFVKRNDAKST